LINHFPAILVDHVRRSTIKVCAHVTAGMAGCIQPEAIDTAASFEAVTNTELAAIVRSFFAIVIDPIWGTVLVLTEVCTGVAMGILPVAIHASNFLKMCVAISRLRSLGGENILLVHPGQCRDGMKEAEANEHGWMHCPPSAERRGGRFFNVA
jgi:hypothetical protein